MSDSFTKVGYCEALHCQTIVENTIDHPVQQWVIQCPFKRKHVQTENATFDRIFPLTKDISWQSVDSEWAKAKSPE